MTGLIGHWPLNGNDTGVENTDGFEDNDLSEWTVNNMTTTDARAYNGTYSAYFDTPVSGDYQAQYEISPAGEKVEEFEYYWQEESSSTGGGIRFKNSQGDYELGVTTDNPGWEIDDANGVNREFAGDGYDRWIRFTLTFNWSNATFDVDFEDLSSGTTYSDTGRPLKNGVDIQNIEIWEYHQGTWGGGNTTSMWFDDIYYRVPGTSPDISGGTQYNGNIYGTQSGSAGVGGSQARHFNGSDDRIDLTDPEPLQFQSEDNFTLSAWINGAGGSHSYPFAYVNNGGSAAGFDGWRFVVTSSNQLVFHISDATTSQNRVDTPDNSIKGGEWYHICAVHNSDTGILQLYLNGEIVDSAPIGSLATIDYSECGAFISGRPDGHNRFNGNMSHVKAYNRSLSASEVEEEYIQGSQASQPLDGVSRWKLDGDATDEWGGNNGTVDGATPAVGKFRECYAFDGIDDQIEVANSPSLTFAEGDEFTVSLWFKLSDVTDGTKGYILHQRENMLGMGYGMAVNPDGELELRSYNGSAQSRESIYSSSTVTTDDWIHGVGIYNWSSGEFKLYVNGVLQETGSVTTNTDLNTVPLKIGKATDDYANNFFFSGKIEDVRVYDRALRDWEIKAIHEGTQDAVKPVTDRRDTPEDGVMKLPLDGHADDVWHGNNGTVAGTTTVDGAVGRALSFDGTDDNIIVPHKDELNPGTGNFTYSAWVRAEQPSSNYRRVLQKGRTHEHGYGLWAYSNNHQLRSFANDSNSNMLYNTRFDVFDGTWHHVTTVIDRGDGEARHYLDGDNVDTDSISDTAEISPPRDLEIGAEGLDDRYHFTGDIDDIRIYNRALSDAEVNQISTPQPPDVPLAHYEFNSNTVPEDGVAKYPLDGDANDVWGGNNGTVNGATEVDGIIGDAYAFDGTTDNNIDLGPQNFLDGATEMSLFFWMNPDTIPPSDQGNPMLYSWGDGWDNHVFLRFGANDGGLAFEVDNGGTLATTTIAPSDLNAGEWTHVGLTFDNGTMRVYHNGEEYDVQGGPSTLPTSSNNARLGVPAWNVTNTTNAYTGVIDDVQIYDRVLSDDEAASLVNSIRDIQDTANEFNGANNGVAFTNGVRGQAGSFNGSDSYADIKNIPALDTLSISYWAKSQGGRHINLRENNSLQVKDTGGLIEVVLGHPDASFSVIDATGKAGVWNHWAVTFNDSQLKLYKNGSLQDSIQASNMRHDNGGGDAIGIADGYSGNEYQGEIDDVRIYDRELPVQEIQELYQYGTRGTDLTRELIQ